MYIYIYGGKRLMKYLRCLRCELNYIKEGEQYCQICKQELSGKYSDYENINIDDNICPYCEKNKLDYDDEMCKVCKNKKLLKELKNKSEK
jgi:RNA polymerase subunit RPABC4/transcription elongation factor Spt4